MRKLQRDLANCLSPCPYPGTRPPSNGNFSAHSMQRAAGNCCCSKLNQHAIKFASKMKRTIYRECSARLGFRMFFTLFYFFSLIFRIFAFRIAAGNKKVPAKRGTFPIGLPTGQVLPHCCTCKHASQLDSVVVAFVFSSIWQATFGGQWPHCWRCP